MPRVPRGEGAQAPDADGEDAEGEGNALTENPSGGCREHALVLLAMGGYGEHGRRGRQPIESQRSTLVAGR